MKPAALLNNEQHYTASINWLKRDSSRDQKSIRFADRPRASYLGDGLRYSRRRDPQIYVNPDAVAETRRRISALAEGWVSSTAHLSRVSAYRRHPNFSRLMSIGEGVAEYAIDRIRAGDIQYHWLVLLKSVFQTDPTCPEHIGKASLQSSDWLKWFEERQQA